MKLLPTCPKCDHRISLKWFFLSVNWKNYTCSNCSVEITWNKNRQAIAQLVILPIVVLPNLFMLSKITFASALLLFVLLMIVPLWIPNQYEIATNGKSSCKLEKHDYIIICLLFFIAALVYSLLFSSDSVMDQTDDFIFNSSIILAFYIGSVIYISFIYSKEKLLLISECLIFTLIVFAPLTYSFILYSNYEKTQIYLAHNEDYQDPFLGYWQAYCPLEKDEEDNIVNDIVDFHLQSDLGNAFIKKENNSYSLSHCRRKDDCSKLKTLLEVQQADKKEMDTLTYKNKPFIKIAGPNKLKIKEVDIPFFPTTDGTNCYFQRYKGPDYSEFRGGKVRSDSCTLFNQKPGLIRDKNKIEKVYREANRSVKRWSFDCNDELHFLNIDSERDWLSGFYTCDSTQCIEMLSTHATKRNIAKLFNGKESEVFVRFPDAFGLFLMTAGFEELAQSVYGERITLKECPIECSQ